MESDMRTTRVLSMFALFSVVLIVAAVAWTRRVDGKARSQRESDNRKGAHFIVHEWGTFTSFSGSDSVKLEFRPLVDVDLPRFVLDRARQSGTTNPLLKVDLRAL